MGQPLGASQPWRALVATVAALPVIGMYAAFGTSAEQSARQLLAGLVGGLVAVLLWLAVRALRRTSVLSRRQRAQLGAVRRSGVPCGDRRVDVYALDLLDDERLRARRGRWITVAALLLVDALTLTAAVRETAWYLWLYVALPAQVVLVRSPWIAVLDERAARLREGVGDPTPWWHYRPAGV